jgi:hypothetical protein
LTAIPSSRHELRDENTRAVLWFPADSSDGYDVTLAATDADIEITAGRFHSPCDDNPDPEDFVRHALGFVRDLLSPSMRLRELVAGRTPYRWFLESRQGEGWVPELETGLLIWPYWAQRSQRIYVNHHLPERAH